MSVDEEISIPLTHLVNLPSTYYTVLNVMKYSKFIPIAKSENDNIFYNYRPISIQPVVSKILKKVVANKLVKFINNTNQYYEHQYGFRAGKCTIHPIIHLLNKFAQEMMPRIKNLQWWCFLI